MTRDASLLVRIHEVIVAGGRLQFVWRTCQPVLITTTGERLPVDGRSYHAFVVFAENHSSYKRTDAGSTEAGDLVITWEAL